MRVVNALREKDGLLYTRDSMTRFCYQRPEAEFEGNYCAEYGFKVQTPQHTYMFRCNPNYGDYNFYLYAYVARFLEHHMKRPNRESGLSRPATRSCSVSPMATTSAFSRAAEKPATAPAGSSTKPILKPAEGIPAPCIIFANLRSDWSKLTGGVIPLRSSLPVQCFSVLPSSGGADSSDQRGKRIQPVL